MLLHLDARDHLLRWGRPLGPAEGFVAALLAHHAEQADPATGVIDTLLSAREIDVLHDLPSRLTIPEIAKAEGVSENTVKTHVRSIYQKLGVNTRSAAVREAPSRPGTRWRSRSPG